MVVDDAAQGIGEVVRGADLLGSSPRQIWLAEALGLPAIESWAHVPLVLGPDGRRLAKRHGAVSLADRRALGETPAEVLGLLASSLGLCEPGDRPSPRDVLADFEPDSLPTAEALPGGLLGVGSRGSEEESRWTSGNGSARRITVGIVGAGFGGLGMGIRLKQAGIYDFTIFERGESVGGVWRANTYPGAACDVPSHLYSFSFAPGHRWTRRYAPQPEILDYLNEIADDYGLRSAPAARDGGRAGELRSRERNLDGRDRRRRAAPLRRAGHGLRPADQPGDPADRGHRGLRGPHLPLRRMGSRATTSRAAGSR